MRFAVPQFIDVEDKIFGPLTLKQAIYLGGAVGVTLAVFTRSGFILAILIGGPVFLFAVMLAFIRVNNQPFSAMVYAAVFYAIKHKLYLWKKMPKKSTPTTGQSEDTTVAPVAPHMSQSRLKQLAWSLDTKNSMYTKEEQWK